MDRKEQGEAIVRSISWLRKDVFFDLHVPIFHNYAAGGVWNHNSGKSTVLSAVQYAVTGDLSRLGDKEAVFVNRTPNSKDRPHVRLVLDPGDGKEAILTRNLPVDDKAATRRLTHDGKTYTSKTDIDDKITKWTGLTPKALSDFVFVAQGSLTDVITDQTGKRAEVLQKLFGVSEAEIARTALLEHLAKLPQPTDPVLMATLRHQAAEAEALLREAEEEHAAVDEADPEQEASDRETVVAAKRGQELAIAAESARARIVEAEAVLATPKPDKPDPGLLHQARQALKDWEQYRVDNTRYVEATKRYEAASGALGWVSGGERMVAGPEPKPSDELHRLRQAQFAASALATADGKDCPVCGSYLDPTKIDKKAAQELLADLAVAESAFDVAYRQWTAQRDLEAVARDQINQASEKAYEAMRALDAVAKPTKPIIEEAVARALLDAATRAEAVVFADDRQRVSAESIIRTAKAIMNSADTDNIPPQGAVSAAEARLTAAAEARTARASTAAKLNAARRAYDVAKFTLAKAEAAGSDHTKAVGWRQVVEGAIRILHKDAAPAATIRACLADLSDDLNRRLGHLGASFRVAVNEDGGLSAQFPDKIVSSRLLSGGQKVVLSLAWRLAVLDRYAPKAGLLCLDEPTNHLDEARVAALKDAIDAWKPYAKDRQFIIVTHARKLAAACDRVVQLG